MCYNFATFVLYLDVITLIYRENRLTSSETVSPQNSKDKKDSKYDKSRKIKVLRGFLFLFSDIYQ